MANEFKIQITAVDKATATINRINNSVSKMIRPHAELAKSISRFSNVSGMTNLGKSMGKAASEAGKLASRVAKIAAPMTALVGGGTIAGVYELSTAWAKLGAETGRTAEILGISASELDAMRNSGRLFGITAESMTQTFSGFADTLQDARWGRNQKAAAMLQFLGIKLQTTKTGAIDAQAAMLQLADKIKRVQSHDPGGARKLAQSFGVEALLPILIRGSAAMKAYQIEAQRLAGTKTPEMIARATEFSLSMNKMGIAIDGMKTSIGDKLIPVLNPLVQKWTEWIVLNRDLIGQKLAEIADKIAKAFSGINLNNVLDGLGKFVLGCIDLAKWVVKIVDDLGGLKTVMMVVAGVMVTSFVASAVSSIAQLTVLIAKLGMAAVAYRTLGTAAAASAASSGAGAMVAGGASLLSKVLPFARGTGGLAMLLHSADLNSGEDEQTSAENAAYRASHGIAPLHKNNVMTGKITRGIRNNNPGNIMAGSFASKHGAIGSDGRFAIFRSMEEGKNAESSLLTSYLQSGDNTIQKVISKWAPSSENNTAAYVASVSKDMHMGPNDQLRGENIGALSNAINRHENGTSQPQINVHVETKVDSHGGVKTRVATPLGVKISYASPVNM